MYLLKNASQILTMQNRSISPVSGCILFDENIIAMDSEENLSRLISEKYRDLSVRVYDAAGMMVMPGFVDSHTHLVYAGSREKEFPMRLAGKPYLEILKSGGGIHSTVRETRKASSDLLTELGRQRLDVMLQHGTTTVEAKSGYGLDLETELKQLTVINRLDQIHEMDVIPTFMGAHALPKEFKGNSQGYLDFLLQEVMPEIRKNNLARFCDIFCEKGVFEPEETLLFMKKAREMGFELKMHADEIHDIGGASIAAVLGAVSADHLGAVSSAGIKKLRESGTVATLLPATLFYLMSKTYAPARELIDSGVTVAIASDFNPGSCFCESMQMAVTLSMLYMKMTPEEALLAATYGGAEALRLSDRGVLDIGKKADLIVINAPDYLYFAHHFGVNQVKAVFKNGILVQKKE